MNNTIFFLLLCVLAFCEKIVFFQAEVKVHFDATNKRMAFDKKLTIDGSTANFKIIQLWDKVRCFPAVIFIS